MGNMREIKNRIKSIKETMQITKAMKLISAAKLKKARQQLEQTKPFFDKVRATMADILVHSGEIDNMFFDLRDKKAGKKKLYIILSGDKGLAGGYNSNIIKFSERNVSKDDDPLLLVAGFVGRNYFIRKEYNIYGDFIYPVQNPTVYRAREIGEQAIELYKNRTVDEVYIIYTKMVSSMLLEPQIMKILPLEIKSLKQELNITEDFNVKIDERFLYEPSPKEVFNLLVPKYVKGIIYGAFVEAFTSEQSARMTAMDNATSNAEQMLAKLNLFYNRARQAAITQEISEIVGGAAAVQ